MSKKKQEKRWLKMILLSVCMMLFFSLGVEMDANAASKSKSKTTTSSFVFSTPRGQTATAKVRARITEKYTKKGSKSTFNYRDCFISYNRTYSASAPKITRGNGVHKKSATGKTIKSFKKWTDGAYLWDVKVYPYGNGSFNKTSVTYSTSTTNVSGFSYTVYCSGTLVPTKAGSVYMSLKTK